MSKLLEPIDIYCERTSAAFWAEPVNALTNLFFVIAGLHILVLLKKKNIKSTWLTLLAINTIVIGIGSFLFHTFANFWSMWADVWPIMILICATFYYALKYIFKLSHLVSAIAVLFFFILGFVLKVYVPPVLNGSLMYSHALAGLILIGVFSHKNYPKVSKYFIASSGIFILSLSFRAVDMSICALIPLGTHFLWHSFNGLTIWLALRGLLEFNQNIKMAKTCAFIRNSSRSP